MIDATVNTVDASAQSQPSLLARLRIVVPGGEGHLDVRFLAQRFSKLGHQVTTLSRSQKASSLRQTAVQSCDPWRAVARDGKGLGAWMETLGDADALINLAGRSVDGRYNDRNRQEILHSRIRSTTVLGEAILKMRRPPRVWLNASTGTIYRHSLDRVMDEASGQIGGDEPDAPAAWRFSIEVAALVMSGTEGGVFEALLRLVRVGLGGAWGVRQYISWIHEEDFARAIEFLIGHGEISGTVNLAAPFPLPNNEFMSALRDAWGIQLGLPAREWILGIGAFLMRTETELLLKSRRVVPGILQGNGFEFRYPEWPAAARDLVSGWREHFLGEVR